MAIYYGFERSGWAREPWPLSLRVRSLRSATGEATTVRGLRTAKKKYLASQCLPYWEQCQALARSTKAFRGLGLLYVITIVGLQGFPCVFAGITLTLQFCFHLRTTQDSNRPNAPTRPYPRCFLEEIFMYMSLCPVNLTQWAPNHFLLVETLQIKVPISSPNP